MKKAEAAFSDDWRLDCIEWHGEVLEGEYGHWCLQWDDLPIDAHCPEFAYCECFDDARFLELRELAQLMEADILADEAAELL